jgi:hypothetical protein
LTDQLICGFANGKIATINFDMKELSEIVHNPVAFPPILNIDEITKRQLEGQEEDDSMTVPFWGINICYVGTVLPKLGKIMTDKGDAVIACCDRPVVFYEVNESIEMHYLAFQHVRNVACLRF